MLLPAESDIPTRCKLGAVHTTGPSCAIASVEKTAEHKRNTGNRVLLLSVILAYLFEKLPVAVISRAGAHVSCGRSAAKIRLRAGAGGQRDRACAVNRELFGELENSNRKRIDRT